MQIFASFSKFPFCCLQNLFFDILHLYKEKRKWIHLNFVFKYFSDPNVILKSWQRDREGIGAVFTTTLIA